MSKNSIRHNGWSQFPLNAVITTPSGDQPRTLPHWWMDVMVTTLLMVATVSSRLLHGGASIDAPATSSSPKDAYTLEKALTESLTQKRYKESFGGCGQQQVFDPFLPASGQVT